jgi:hypothetical protein
MSPLFTNTDNKSRYRTLQQTRNAPKNDEERAYQQMLVEEEAARILEKFSQEPEFTKKLAINLAKRVLDLNNNKLEQGLE